MLSAFEEFFNGAVQLIGVVILSPFIFLHCTAVFMSYVVLCALALAVFINGFLICWLGSSALPILLLVALESLITRLLGQLLVFAEESGDSALPEYRENSTGTQHARDIVSLKGAAPPYSPRREDTEARSRPEKAEASQQPVVTDGSHRPEGTERSPTPIQAEVMQGREKRDDIELEVEPVTSSRPLDLSNSVFEDVEVNQSPAGYQAESGPDVRQRDMRKDNFRILAILSTLVHVVGFMIALVNKVHKIWPEGGNSPEKISLGPFAWGKVVLRAAWSVSVQVVVIFVPIAGISIGCVLIWYGTRQMITIIKLDREMAKKVARGAEVELEKGTAMAVTRAVGKNLGARSLGRC